ncbi:MAG: Rne/Rng family ribonuclease, partial [Candidatus Tectomicrobia bacterium]|nr:Rne/Rng family ribonuclease [Candidatus Tectomicrobia bacterium]
GVVVNVEPSLQAAFVDYGENKAGFLPLAEVHPECYANGATGRRISIREALKRGQNLLVQIVKDEIGGKGAALTTYASLPGRYLVLMPGSDNTGISRKIEDEVQRQRLRKLMEQLSPPPNMGFIVRTAGYNRTKNELSRDLSYLQKLWESIQELSQKLPAPSLVYQEQDLVIRSIRDYFTADIQEVLIDNKEVHKRAKEFFRKIMPRYQKLLKLHQERRPLFFKYQLEEQIELIYEPKVPLKSGGSIVIQPTEAMVSIDVNSGRSTQERGMEETAYRTNLEAAEEIARQLRLRDLGGLIVIDFIDMKDRKHILEVEKCLKNAAKRDKARIQMSRISRFALLEMSRQRIKTALATGSYEPCPACEGRGAIKTVEIAALSSLRKIHGKVAKGDLASVRAAVSPEVAAYLLNHKRLEISRMEREEGLTIYIQGQPGMLVHQMNLECVKRSTIAPLEPQPEVSREEIEKVPALEAPLPSEEPAALEEAAASIREPARLPVYGEGYLQEDEAPEESLSPEEAAVAPLFPDLASADHPESRLLDHPESPEAADARQAALALVGERVTGPSEAGSEAPAGEGLAPSGEETSTPQEDASEAQAQTGSEAPRPKSSNRRRYRRSRRRPRSSKPKEETNVTKEEVNVEGE